MNEKTIVELAIENLEKSTSFQAHCLKEKISKELDGTIILKFREENIKLVFEVRKELRNHQLAHIERLSREYPNFFLIAYKLDHTAKKHLRELDVPYLESNGNFYLHKEKFFFWLDNNKPLRSNKEKTNRAFTKTGLKVVFHFLQFEEDINLPYRTIAETTGTALGNVPNVLNGLKEQDFLLPLNKKQYKLRNKKELLERWMTAYQQDLKPSLEIGTFRFLKHGDFLNWQALPLKEKRSWWGAEPAGELLTNYLKPEVLTIYTLESRGELMKNYRLIPDPTGNVQAYQKFWKKDALNDSLAPPLLVYTDLMNTGDRRCMETAQKLYNEHLQDKL